MRPVTPVPLKIASIIGTIAPDTRKKTASMVKSLLDFDTDSRRPAKRLVTPQTQTVTSLLSEPQRKTMSELHTFSERQVDILINCFRGYGSPMQSKLLSESAFWKIIGRGYSILQSESTFRSRMYSIFNTSKREGLTLIEFILAVAVLADRATFMSRAHFAHNVLVDSYGILDLTILNDLPTVGTTEVVFHVIHPSGEIDITRDMFIRAWKKILAPWTQKGTIGHHKVEEIMDSNPSASLLLFPFGIHTPIEELCG